MTSPRCRSLIALLCGAMLLAAVAPGAVAQESGQPTETVTRQTEVYLGVVTEPVSEAMAAQLRRQLPDGRGLLVKRLLPGSPAERAGLRPLDIIAATDGQPVGRPDELKERILRRKPAELLKMNVIREGESQTLDVSLGERTVSTLISRHFPPPAASGGAERAPSPEPSDSLAAAESVSRTLHALTLRTKNGRQFDLHLEYLDAEGKSQVEDLSGEPSALRADLKTLPVAIQQAASRHLDIAEREKLLARTIQFRCSPGQQGPERTLQISVRQPESSGAVRWFELERTVSAGPGPTPLAQTLELPEIQSQLGDMDPAVRARIEQTLKTASLPAVGIKREESQ
jgi:hypothetical protein